MYVCIYIYIYIHSNTGIPYNMNKHTALLMEWSWRNFLWWDDRSACLPSSHHLLNRRSKIPGAWSPWSGALGDLGTSDVRRLLVGIIIIMGLSPIFDHILTHSHLAIPKKSIDVFYFIELQRIKHMVLGSPMFETPISGEELMFTHKQKGSTNANAWLSKRPFQSFP